MRSKSGAVGGPVGGGGGLQSLSENSMGKGWFVTDVREVLCDGEPGFWAERVRSP